MKWTKEPPGKPGWYWARRDGDSGKVLGAPSVVRVRSGDRTFDPLVAEHCGVDADEVSELSEFDLWCGPLQPPPLPSQDATTDAGKPL